MKKIFLQHKKTEKIAVELFRKFHCYNYIINGLPSALVITAELDSLKAEAEHYAEKFRKAWVNVKYHNCKDVSHGFYRK